MKELKKRWKELKDWLCHLPGKVKLCKLDNISWQQAVIAICIAVCAALIIFFLFRSCGKGTDYDFDSSDDALHCYHDYLERIKETKTSDGRQMCEEINRWQELSDTIYRYIDRDSTLTAHHRREEYLDRFYNINDSVKYVLANLTETWKCSFSDVILVKEGTTPFRNDQEILEAVRAATPFFLHLDSMKVQNVTKKEALQLYRAFLSVTEKQGIHSKKEMLFFIENEDVIFRQFLRHLYDLDDEPVSDITHSTERICVSIFREARIGNIDAKDALTYMSMRMVRRLLQNSRICVNDIGTHKMHSKMQANAYLWMIIQPFMSIDAFAIATMTPEAERDLQYIADKLPKSTLFAKAFDIDQNSLSYLLPQQLLKMYILTL